MSREEVELAASRISKKIREQAKKEGMTVKEFFLRAIRPIVGVIDSPNLN
jgi:hypothetical protein